MNRIKWKCEVQGLTIDSPVARDEYQPLRGSGACGGAADPHRVSSNRRLRAAPIPRRFHTGCIMRLVEIRESVLGGLGLFALRDFAPGDVVLSETAFLTAKGLDWESDEASISPDSVSSRLITKTVRGVLLSPRSATHAPKCAPAPG